MSVNSANLPPFSLEVEQKYHVKNVQALREKLQSLGAVWEQPIEQVDLYFAHPAKDFKQTDEALRIRRVGNENWVTYKGPKIDQETKTRRELELPLAAGEQGFKQFAELLTLLGFTGVAEVRKQRLPGRLIWEGTEITLALDHLATLGDFVELEIVTAPEELAAAKARLASLALALGMKEPERRGYLDLLM